MQMTHEILETIWNRIKAGESVNGWHGTSIGGAVDQFTNESGEIWLRDSSRIWRPAFFTGSENRG